MRKSRRYRNTRFAPEVIVAAADVFRGVTLSALQAWQRADATMSRFPLVEDTHVDLPYERSAWVGDDEWSLDTEAEFVADYRRGGCFAFGADDVLLSGSRTPPLGGQYPRLGFSVVAREKPNDVVVSVTAPERSAIEGVFRVFDAAASQSKVKTRGQLFRQHPLVVGIAASAIVGVVLFFVGLAVGS